jgi:tyrosyl-tRNA synthetase
LIGKDEIDKILNEHSIDPGSRQLQKKLALELTLFVHGKEELEKALATTEKLFSGQVTPAEQLSEEDLDAIEGIIKCDIEASILKNGIDVITLLTETRIFPSKGEARKMIQNGGVSINRHKVEEVMAQVNSEMLLHKKFLLVQKGKKHYYLVKAN